MLTYQARLKIAMREAGISQKQLALQTAISESSISMYLAGKATPPPNRKRAIEAIIPLPLPAPRAEVPTRMPYKISVKDAAECMGKGGQFVRVGLQRGILPIGDAIQGSKGKWGYYISPPKLREYVGAERFDSFFKGTA